MTPLRRRINSWWYGAMFGVTMAWVIDDLLVHDYQRAIVRATWPVFFAWRGWEEIR